MKIIEKRNPIVNRIIVEHGGDRFRRALYKNGNIEWMPLTYDGETEDENSDLENEFQKLIKNEI